jgi:3-oxoacyl-[acyl-carrier-protein] synthase-1
MFIPSTGFGETGTTVQVNICTTKIEMPMKAGIKTMAGFGGCNAALVFSKIN